MKYIIHACSLLVVMNFFAGGNIHEKKRREEEDAKQKMLDMQPEAQQKNTNYSQKVDKYCCMPIGKYFGLCYAGYYAACCMSCNNKK